MHQCRIGNCALGETPRTIVIIDDFLPLTDVKKLKKEGADLIEMRVDGFNKDIDAICDYIKKVRKTVPMPIVGTIRENEWTKKDRIALFAKVIPLVDAIDIEIDASINKKVIAMAAGKTIIVSEHDFSGTPKNADLNHIVKKAFSLGCHIVKIAAMARSREDVVRLLEFIHHCKKPIVAFSMGEVGAISRFASFLFGSLYTYGFVKKANAPGQLDLSTLVEELRRYYP